MIHKLKINQNLKHITKYLPNYYDLLSFQYYYFCIMHIEIKIVFSM
jgi:hypothetical protein